MNGSPQPAVLTANELSPTQPPRVGRGGRLDHHALRGRAPEPPRGLSARTILTCVSSNFPLSILSAPKLYHWMRRCGQRPSPSDIHVKTHALVITLCKMTCLSILISYRDRAGRCTVNPLSRGFALCSFSYLQSTVVRKHDVEGSRNQQCTLLSSAMKSCAVQLQPAQTRTVASSSTDTPQTPAHLSRHSRFRQQTHCHGVAGLGFRLPLFYLSTTLLREGRGAGTSDTPGRSRDTRPFSGKVSVTLWTFREQGREATVMELIAVRRYSCSALLLVLFASCCTSLIN